jgi:catalase (peroxidase I)
LIKHNCDDVNSTSNDRSTGRNAGVKHNFNSNNGVFTQRQVLTNDFFLNLLDMTTTWKSVSESDTIFEGHNRTTES